MQNLEIKITYETTDIKTTESISNYKLITGVNGSFSFTIVKTSSRFMPRLLACAKEGERFMFDLYAEVEDISGTGLEGIYIQNAWVDGTFSLLNLQAQTDITTLTFTGEFYVEAVEYEYTTQDGLDWSTKRSLGDYAADGQRLIGVPLR